MNPPRNIVGQMVRKRRNQLDLSQGDFAARCQRMGWDISRDIVARIELQIRIVPDFELVKLAEVLGISIEELMAE